MLSTVREINDAVQANINGCNNGVYCRMANSSVLRVSRARTVQGQLQVYAAPGRWVVPVMVYQA